MNQQEREERERQICERVGSVPSLSLWTDPKKNGAYHRIYMDDAGDLRFVADVNDMRGNYSALFENACHDLAYLLAEVARLRTAVKAFYAYVATIDEARHGCYDCRNWGEFGYDERLDAAEIVLRDVMAGK